MSAVGWICGLVGLLLMWIIVETLKSLFLTETLTRLERVPYAILRLARRRLRPEQRETVHDEEWLPELAMIVRESEGLPLTRLVRGVDYAIGLVFAASKISKSLTPAGDRPEHSPDFSYLYGEEVKIGGYEGRVLRDPGNGQLVLFTSDFEILDLNDLMTSPHRPPRRLGP